MALRSKAADGDRTGEISGILERNGHGGGFWATILSGVALVFSGYSYYDSSLKAADLSVFVPPMIHYGRDGGSDVFNIPITITNEGARAGTVLMMELQAENLRPDAPTKKARFYSAFFGEFPRGEQAVINRSFAPLSIVGNGTFTETIRFYPMDTMSSFLVDDKGDYRFTLKLVTARPQDPNFVDRLWKREPLPLSFNLNMPFFPVHSIIRGGTASLFNTTWNSAVSTSGEPQPQAVQSESANP
jgi:hypothetical protein